MLGIEWAGLRGRFPAGVGIPALLQRPAAQAAAALAIGMATAGLAYFVLDTLLAPPNEPAAIVPVSETAPAATVVQDSLAGSITPGRVAAGVPMDEFEMAANAAGPGDRIDVIALVPPDSPTPMAAVVVRGATYLGRPGQGLASPMLLEVTPEEAIVLAHLVQSGTRLSYALWPADGTPPPVEPVDVAALRQLFQEQLERPTSAP